MLALTTLDRWDPVSPSAAERSRRELTRRDCLAWGIVSGSQEVRSSRPGGEDSRPFGIGGDEIRRMAEYVLSVASLMLCGIY